MNGATYHACTSAVVSRRGWSPSTADSVSRNGWRFCDYAKWYDILYMALGSMFAITAGTCMPVVYYLLGRTITVFTDYAAMNASINNASYFCDRNQSASVSITSGDLTTQVTYYSSLIIGIAIVLFLTSALANTLWTLSALNQTKRIREAFLRSVIMQDIQWYDVNPPVLLPTRLISDVQKIEDGIGNKVASFIIEFTTFFVGLMVALILNWKLALVVISFMPVLLIVIFMIGKLFVSITTYEQTVLAEAGAIAEEAFTLIKTVIAFGGQKHEEERYSKLLKKAKNASYLKQVAFGFIVGFFSFVIFCVYGLGLWYGAIMLVDCEITSGKILTILFEIASGCLHINESLPLLASIAGAFSAKSTVYSIIDQVNENENLKNELETLKGHVQFSNVTFAYPSRPAVPILQRLNLVVEPGQTVALVGHSGSGKSTILQLLQCIYTPDNGTVTIDGFDIVDLNANWLRNQIGIVSQEPVLFNVSIAENISYGKDGATDEEIKTAAKQANAYNFIMELPHGFNTLVGDGGTQLSGGQKQRIAIARALIRNPKILLLDEATSALDTESEKIVQEALDRARMDRTTIIIAHRLSTIQSVNMILVVDEGRIVECGTHNQLLKEGGLYSELVANQITREEAKDDDFNRAYRKSIRRQHSARFRIPSGHATSINEMRRASGNEIRRASHMHVTPVNRDKSFFKSIPQRLSENFIAVSSSPNLASSQKNSFDEDDVFDYWPDELPTEIEERTGKLPASFKTLLELSKPDLWLLLLGIAGFVVVGVVLSAIYVLISGAVEVYTEINRDRLLERAFSYFMLYLAFGFGSFALHFISVFCLGLASDRLTNRLREKCFKAIMSQSVSFFDEPDNSISILTQILTNDPWQVSQVTGVLMGITIRGIVNIIAGFVIVLEAAWVLGLLSLSTVIVFVLGGALQLKLTNVYTTKSQKYSKESVKTAVESIANIYTVTILGVQERLLQKYHSQLEKPYWYNVKNSIVQAIFYSFVQSFLVLITAVMLNLGVIIYTADPNSIYYADLEDIIRAAGMALLTSLIFKELYRGIPDTESARIAATNILTLLNRKGQCDNSDTGLQPTGKNQPSSIKARLVEFVYPSRPDVHVLNGFSIHVKPGTTLALVGPSGSGKSTVLSLIERFYDPLGGSILFDSDDLHELNVSWLRRQMSLVSQEPVLFDMSIADNIRYGALFREVTDKEIVEAAISANIHNFILSLPQGYQTNVGSGGTQLSGGQKQRIAIARALIRNPKILLLDEATSALDTESEKVVQEALDRARVGRTTIIVAHRLSTIYNADSIAVLHRGQVIEKGTHSELMNKKGAYFFMNNVNKD